MASGGVNLASGSRASIRYCRERVRNETPAGIATPADPISAVADGGGSGLSKFARSAGSFVDDGYFPGQTVQTAGFGTGANNADWVISVVSATELTVIDSGDVITDETAATGQTVRILMRKFRGTGRNINLEKNILESSEVDEDGMETDARHGFNRVVGSPGAQLGRQDFDDALEFVTNGAWTAVTVTGSPDLGVNGTTKKFTRATGSFITDGFRPGDVIRTSLFTNTVNNGDWQVSVVTALELTVIEPTGVTMVTESEAGSKSLTMPGKRLDVTAGLCTTLVERGFLDVGRYQVFNGVAWDTWQNTVSPESIINCTFGLLGMSAAAMASSPLSSVDPVDLSGLSPFAAFDGKIFEGGAEIAVVTSIDWTLSRNRSLNPVVGSKFSPDVFEGTARIAGTLVAYFEDEVLFNKFVDETESNIWNKFKDPTDPLHFMNVVMPRVKYNGGAMDPPQEGPVPVEMPYRALKASNLPVPGGTTVNTNMSIQRSNA